MYLKRSFFINLTLAAYTSLKFKQEHKRFSFSIAYKEIKEKPSCRASVWELEWRKSMVILGGTFSLRMALFRKSNKSLVQAVSSGSCEFCGTEDRATLNQLRQMEPLSLQKPTAQPPGVINPQLQQHKWVIEQAPEKWWRQLHWIKKKW